MTVGDKEGKTQSRVVAFFQERLGYKYLGDWRSRVGNSNVEEDQLATFLRRQGHSSSRVDRAVIKLRRAAAVGGSWTLYEANHDVYRLLRYGVKVQPAVGEQSVTVWLVDWDDPEANDFAVAEEVTISGESRRRPDLVLYVNGIAVGVLELKRSIVSVEEGIRQNLGNQRKEAIRPFFATVQLLMAGNETEGLRYGVVETPEKYWLHWKETEAKDDAPLADAGSPLLRELAQMCNKERLLEIVHDFMVFDAGVKKTCRHNQYFGVRAAQERVRRHEGGIVWHTQGSGKSLVMVWLAKWIRENVSDGRVLIVTDRTELDEQIEKVFKGVGENIRRTHSGGDLVRVLGDGSEWLVCSLVHKFGSGDEGNVDGYVEEIHSKAPTDFHARGQFFVFVDECHRTQSGKLHRTMKELLPDAMLIGFTGTPLLKSDKQRSIETFGPYIHTYKYNEAVQDRVVLDLRYEARDIDQHLRSEDKVDQWFKSKTRGLTDVAKAQIKQRWGTMRTVLSSRERLERIVADIAMDMETRDRLRSGRGNAMLVSDSIYQACRLYEMFQKTELRGRCAVVTSYRPSLSDTTGEETGEGLTERLQRYAIYRKMLAEHFNEPEDAAMNKVDRFEEDVKKRFVEHPGQMKLLIVVDKLLTGFDAPPATYLYIDKQMRDHGLFQAICRINRLDGDKEYGYVVDYKDLFRSLERSVQDYTGEAFEGYDAADVDGLLKDRLQLGRERLEETRDQVKALCEPVQPPCDTDAYLLYYCPSASSRAPLGADQNRRHERKRVHLYRAVVAFARAYANLAGEMTRAGYSAAEAAEIKAEVQHYENVRQEVKLASGDYVDMKMFEPAMRHLLDTYIRAEEAERVTAFDDMTLVQLIVEQGGKALDQLPSGIRHSEAAVAETIENNVRRLIVDEMAVNPRYYGEMSEVLNALIEKRKQDAIDYKDYLDQMIKLARRVGTADTGNAYPPRINNAGRQAIYDNVQVREPPPAPYESVEEAKEAVAVAVDRKVRDFKKADWRGGIIFKQREALKAIRLALRESLGEDVQAQKLYDIIEARRDDY